ncbi:hypothetical protein LCGC14_2706420 [marine sediment metagenome]|uniref:EamA domain-containing protein n=1 Tax=marine sediment metagenome TaxID=412755 RepID=A0A0F9BNA8_9ZZZZ
MGGDNLRYAAIMLAAGIGIPVLATLNAALGARIGAPVVASLVLFAVAFTVALAVGALTGLGAVSQLTGQPFYLFGAGLLVAFYILSITWIAPRFGIGNAVFFVLLGQMLSAAVIDHFGLFGARQQSLTAMRALGIAMMALGVLATQKA